MALTIWPGQKSATASGAVGRGTGDEPPKPRVQLSAGVIFIVAAILAVGTIFLDAPIEMSMFFAMVALMLILAVRGFNFDEIQDAAFNSMRTVLELVMILLSVGMLISTWAQAGTIPVIIRFGLETINPTWFYVTALLLCSITSLVTGTSWGTMGSVGVALMAVGGALDLPAGLTAGAIISGAYFGDKMSPLSDSTNLSAAITGVPLFSHIRYLLITTVPAYICTVVLFTVLGFVVDHNDNTGDSIDTIVDGINRSFDTGWFSLLPVLVTVAMLIFRVPPFISIFAGAVGAMCVSMTTQGATVEDVIAVLHSGFVLDSGTPDIDGLISGGGLLSMAGLAMLFLFAVGTSGLLNKGGFVGVIIEKFLRFANTRRRLMSLTSPVVFTSVGLGASFSFAAVMAGTLLLPGYRKLGLDPRNLGRTIEDSGTVYDPFFPWSSGGIFAAGALGVATLDYMPFLFFAFFSTGFGLLVALTQFTVATVPDEDEEADGKTGGETGGETTAAGGSLAAEPGPDTHDTHDTRCSHDTELQKAGQK
ncbi:Na+/H+ antiporter NhaC [Corynebacterium sp.]|uniref:Na+/H+ antiporter NhaC n=1 Tax=Corynebacterium sp. TaxID=1720 RepID=UPI0025B7F5D0|nr:Na+/H+ antiporter NhaC [Corynebacterium sp.]